MDVDPFHWRPWRGDASPTVDLDGKTLPLQSSLDIGSSTESVKLGRHGDERSSGKSTKSTTSGYLTMSCLKHEPSEDSDASADRPARPPKPARLSPSRGLSPPALCEYVEVEPRPPERRPRRPDPPDPERAYRCREYELMTDFTSRARPADTPPAVPPRARPPPRHADPSPAAPVARAASSASLPGDRDRPVSKLDSVSNDDSLLDELQRDTYCVLKVCEDDTPEEDSEIPPDDAPEAKGPDHATFSRISMKRKSNPIKSQAGTMKPLKTSNSTSNVHDAGTSTSRPLAERLTPFFLKKKKPPEDAQAASRCPRKEDNFIGRLTPRFGQSRLYGRGQSLELAPADARKRIERSATTVNIPTRPINSSIVANLKFFSLHRYGAQEDVECRAFVRTEPEPAADEAWAHAHAPPLAAASSDVRL